MSDFNETPSLANVIRGAIEARLAELHVSLPGEIVKYYPAMQKADVQVHLQRMYSDGTLQTLPVILNVPVAHWRAGKSIVHMPIAKGDIVQLVFTERSLDKWKANGGITDPEDPRKHTLSDCIAYPGGYPFGQAYEVANPKALTIQNDTVEIQVRDDGKVSIKADEIFLGDHTLTEQVAIASRVEARVAACESGITQIVTDVNNLTTAYIAHTHTTTLPGAPTGPGLPTGIPPLPFMADTSVIGSDTVKLKT